MQQDELQIGYIVHLNSGSPDLKVVAIEGDEIAVEWRNETNSLERMSLPRVCFTIR
jgi:hypothetical protein